MPTRAGSCCRGSRTRTGPCPRRRRTSVKSCPRPTTTRGYGSPRTVPSGTPSEGGLPPPLSQSPYRHKEILVDQATVIAILGSIFANIGNALPALIPVLYVLLVASFLDLGTGVWAAWKSGTLNGSLVGEYVRSHIALKIGPIMLTLLAGVAVGGTDSDGGKALIAGGAVSAGLYLTSVVNSIKDNVDDGKAKTKG